METNDTARVARLMRRVWNAAPQDFVGLGVIVYNGLDELPHLPLKVPAFDAQFGGVVGEEAVATSLARISALHSPWHDGFHFVRLSDFRLTHVAQFVSPPIPVRAGAVTPERGARHMTATLASMVNGIALACVLPTQGEMFFYKNGKRVRMKEVD